MKKYWRQLLTIGCVIASFLLMQTIDPAYKTNKNSLKLAQNKNARHIMASPTEIQFKSLLNNHWKISLIYSQLEDIFYPFRKWSDHPLQFLKSTDQYSIEKNHINSLKKVKS